jgi:rubrerythrin
MDDPPSKAFLKENIAKERDAIESYVDEMNRTNDPVQKEAIRGLAIDEMRHLDVLEGVKKKKEESDKE